MCTKASDTKSRRHEAINNLLQLALKTAEIPAIRELPRFSGSDGKKSNGLRCVTCSRCRSLRWDYTCAYTFEPSYLDKASICVRYAAKLTEEETFEHC